MEQDEPETHVGKTINEQIKRFKEFIELNYGDQLVDNLSKGKNFLVIDFVKLLHFDTDVADLLLDKPEDVIKAAELSIEDIDLDKGEGKCRVRFINLPDSRKIEIRNIRSKDLNRFFFVKGVIRQKSDVRPQVTTAKFECPACGNTMIRLQIDGSFKEPTKCACGRKGKFHLVEKELVDAQGVVLEEAPEDLEGGEQPKRLNIFLKDDLVSPFSEKRTSPGSTILVTGVIKEVPIFLKTGAQSTRYDLIMDANAVVSVQTEYADIEITKEDEKRIKELAQDPHLARKLVESMAPSIYGHEKVKEALLLQLCGGLQKKRDHGANTRGDIHILLIGDPGGGKSQLLKRVNAIAPKSRYVSGKGASGAGLTAAVVRDEFLKGWSLEAGALVLANNGLVCIDEMDKMSNEDRAAMHEALEQQTVSIAKANVQATLLARTTVLAAANPKLGRFDPYEPIAKQIDLPPTLISRFDLIFPIRDIPDKEKDEKLAEFILALHQNTEMKEPELPTPFLRKYIAYAKQHIFPKLSVSALEELKGFYLKMRASGSGEGEIKTIPITPRQLEGLVRLAEAAARLRLSPRVSKKDAKKAVELLHYCLAQIGVDPDTGKIDIDRITTGVTASERSKIVMVREIITELEEEFGKAIPFDKITEACRGKGISTNDLDDAMEKLKRQGDIYQPKPNFIQRL
ncbi:minichromosome maintenance protein MCM [Candidatus Woesearchaeota archaeon]|nr:minichromosome maintenance protein MCM [Candidatus Woesearchaeota archaeon]